MSISVRAFPVMPTRPCQYCFALQDGGVFADFDANQNDQLFLVRISFDGYGCCHPEWSKGPITMSVDDSRKLTELIQHLDVNDVAHPDVAHILSSYFVACGDAIWVDALKDHELI